VSGAIEAVAREFSPRVEVHKPGLVTLDIAGLGRLLGSPEEIGGELREACARRSLPASVAVAATRTAAMLLAAGRPGLTVVPAGEERRRLAPLALACLGRVFPREDAGELLGVLERWGLRTLGDLARLPSAALSARIGQDGLAWQRLARGEDLQPLLAMPPIEPIVEQADLEWPVEGLEPLSFVLARLFEALAERLERLDQAATALHASFRLASRETVTRTLQLPAPMRDPKVLRTLILLHLESHPLGAGVDVVAVRVDTARARVTQFSLLGRALPFPEQVAPLVARLAALVGERRVGAPALVDTYRPGAFAMRPFVVGETRGGVAKGRGPRAAERVAERPPSYGSPSPFSILNSQFSIPQPPRVAIRRFRLPVPARVTVAGGRPVRVTTERRGLEGGTVASAAGPWRTSGEWWRVPDARVQITPGVDGRDLPASVDDAASGEARVQAPVPGRLRAAGQQPALRRADADPTAVDRRWIGIGWNRDEWDVALSDGSVYRIYRDRSRDRWFVDGIVD
jgi:protein ImuB